MARERRGRRADQLRAEPHRYVSPARHLHRKDLNPSSPIRPAVLRFSQSKWLIGHESRGPNPRKSAVVPTKSILTAANMPIIGGHHVLALQGPPEGWQATLLHGSAGGRSDPGSSWSHRMRT